MSQGGTPIQPADAPRIASEAGAEGGTINTANNTAQGSYGGWSVSMNGYANPGAGHLAALVAYSGGQLQSDYLYRVAVPGQPQLNTMQTNLNMGNNNVQNANNVQANTAQLAGGQPNGQPGALQIGSNYYYGDGSNAAVRTPGSFYIQNQNGSGPAQIAEVSNVWGSGELQGGYINSTGDVNAQNALTAGPGSGSGGGWVATYAGNSSQAGSIWASGNINTPGFYADNNGYSGTTDTFTAGSRVILGTAFGSANIGWGCSPNGEIAANANGSGQILACQGGTWQAMGGGDSLQQQFTFPNGSVGTWGIGNWHFCALTGYGQYANAYVQVYPVGGPYPGGTYAWDFQSTSPKINAAVVSCF